MVRLEWNLDNETGTDLWRYMRLLLTQDLRLTFFEEPDAISNDDERAIQVRRRPWAMVMEWRKD
jgi:hypothetical protein